MSDTDPQSSNGASADLTAEAHTVSVPSSQDAARDNAFMRLVRALFRWKNSDARADLQEVLEESVPAETGFSPEEVTLLKNILSLREIRVSDVMVPRADIVSVQQGIAIGELVKIFERAGHSRLVVYNDTLDDPVGMVHIRDLIAFITARASVDPKVMATKPRLRKLTAGLDLRAVDLSMPLADATIMRTILFVPPSMPAMDLLAKMQATRIHLALVVDEYGGTDGLVSIEDIVEQIVGEIEDEHDSAEAPRVIRQADGSYIADARANLEDVVATIGNGFEVGEAAEEVDTLGGYLVTQIGRVPVRGELVPGPGNFEFEVLEADPRRIKKIKIHSGRPPAPAYNRKPKNASSQGKPIASKAASSKTPVSKTITGKSPANKTAASKTAANKIAVNKPTSSRPATNKAPAKKSASKKTGASKTAIKKAADIAAPSSPARPT